MKKNIKKLKEQVRRKVDVKATIIKESIMKCVDNSFILGISNKRMPRMFFIPHCKKYD